MPGFFKWSLKLILFASLLNSSATFAVEADSSFSNPPLNIHATVGDQSLHLSWESPDQIIDRYRIEIAEVDGDTGELIPRGHYEFVPESMSSVKGETQQSSYTIQYLPDGTTRLENSKQYRVTVQAESDGKLNVASAPVGAVPNAINADPPPYPVLFVHGFNGSSSGTFGDTTQFLTNELSWTPGGNFRFNGSSLTVNPENFDSNGDFYTLDFGESNATYTDGRGLMHQADEIAAVVDFLAANGVSPIMLMGHSNGGLASRYYVAHTPQVDTKIKKYISYGSPHRGADLSFFGSQNDHGVRDTFYTCSPGNEVVYQGNNLFFQFVDNQFLTNLSQDTLPVLDDGYIAIIGSQGGRSPNCHNTDIGDSVIARTSADLREINLPPENINTLLTDHWHVGQGNHFNAVLCALEDDKCANVVVRYPEAGGDPVTLQITSPSGQVMREAGNSLPELIEIPAAELMEVPDAGGIDSNIGMIPLAEHGQYTIQLTAAAGAAPTDIFSLAVNVSGVETVLAQNMMVQDIPAGGFKVQVPLLPAHSDFSGDLQSDVLAVNSNGVLISVLFKDSIFQDFGVLLQADPAAGWTVNATGDFNGDKKADILLYNTTTGEYRIVLMDGTSLISDTVVFTIDPSVGVEPRGVGDFDGDGEAEIIIYQPASGFTGLVYLAGGSFSTFEAVTTIDAANNWTLENTGHFNSDNKTDLLIYNTVTGETAVIEMDGSVPTGPTTIFTLDPATGWAVKDTGDFTGNGSSDVVILHTSGALGVLTMDGLTFQTIYVPGGMLAGWELVNVGNYDSINKADFLIFDTTTSNLLTGIQDGTAITSFNPILNLGAGWSYESGKP